MTKLKIGYSLIFLIILSSVLFIGGTMPYFLFYIFSLTLLIPLIHTLITLLDLKGYVKIPTQSLFSGEMVNIEYKIKNNSIFPITYLEIKNDISKQLTGFDSPSVILSLGKKQSFSNKETVLLKRRGYYQLGEIKVTIRDVFGLYTFKKKISNSTSLLVYPETINLSTFKISASHQLGDLLVHNSFFEDKSRVTSIREYREGDSVKSIHWKLSAKKDFPIIKNYENSGDTHAIIFIDNEVKLFKDDVDRRLEDKAVDTALSIVNYCLNQNIEINLKTQNAAEYIDIKGKQNSDLKPFLEALARFKGNGALQFDSIIMPKVEMLKRGSTVIIITPNLDKSMGAHGIYMKMKNLNPLFIVITDIDNKTGYIDSLIQKRLKQEGIPMYIIDYRTNIKETLEVFHG